MTHQGHDHPNTSAARAKCRRMSGTELVVRASGTTTERVIRATPIDGPTYVAKAETHCELCGIN